MQCSPGLSNRICLFGSPVRASHTGAIAVVAATKHLLQKRITQRFNGGSANLDVPPDAAAHPTTCSSKLSLPRANSTTGRFRARDIPKNGQHPREEARIRLIGMGCYQVEP